MKELTEYDQLQLGEKGIKVSKLQEQVALFLTGVPPVNLVAPAHVGTGIFSLSRDEAIQCVATYQKKKNSLDILKFVPASGSATRMFQFLSAFTSDFNPLEQTFEAYVKESGNVNVQIFFEHLQLFAFYESLQKYIQAHHSLEGLSEDEQKLHIAKILLEEEPFNYKNKPKGLFPFHKYGEKVVTAFEEHFREAFLYASQGEVVNIHFTIGKEYTNQFLSTLAEIRPSLEKQYGVHFEVSFSHQSESTDTVALTLDNEFFRDENNKLLFRPAGHGALLKNLNELNADIIFIKNIDNVVAENYGDEAIFYKEVLAGKLEETRSKVHKILKQIQNEKLKKKDLPEALKFLSQLNIKVPSYVYKFAKRYMIEYIYQALNRPIRVCGMVKNEGEIGGGPFWVRDEERNESLQIIETAQIDKKNPKQWEILQSSTHFNPVDIVCCIKNFKGEMFDLEEFQDKKLSFITEKSYNGIPLKALELPGLWNGAMAGWISIFVEVPQVTFNPVKSVNDLLKKNHQGS
ncbi:DUF4301 family protein [uncultured Capnocytophaga sp.]|jgi:hypothetical protein|uniref:DUF4301 family protein n=1 Tax=uncultured Capnocytophaga sp. TaxID=159273 RepID=UPI0028E83D62|nr:DUF4301 family protein [uncultured Capnocytophaga sp.]